MLTISIVLYNTSRKHIDRLLDSLNSANCESIFLIDNSTDDRLRVLEKRNKAIQYIRNKNIGYGASHNIALKRAVALGSDYHLILNPDIYFDEFVLHDLLDYMGNNSEVAYVLPKVLYPNGDIQYLCRLLPNPFDLFIRRFFPVFSVVERVNFEYCLKKSGYNRIMNPPCLSGCFMFLRMSFIKKYNIFFDERFFMYLEDYDFIRRLHSVGKTIFYPYVTIIHDHAKESYNSKKMLFEHVKSAIKYFNKWGWFFDKERSMMNNKILQEIKNLS
jgi:GT2 family glycosyltransferase